MHMLIDIVPILVMSSPGLFFTNDLPAWLMILGVISAGAVTVISIGIFIFMLKKAHKKNIQNKKE